MKKIIFRSLWVRRFYFVSKRLLILVVLIFSPCGTLAAMELDEAISMAIQRSPLLSEKIEEQKAAIEALKAAQGELFPRMDARVSATRLSDPIAVVPIKSFQGSPPSFSRDIYDASIDLVFPIYQGGALRSKVSIARSEDRASANQKDFTAQTLVSDVKAVFYQILGLKDLVEATRESLDAVTRLRDDTKKRFDAGEIARVDLLRIETRQAQERQALVSAQKGLERAKNTLTILIGADGAVDANGNLTEPQPVEIITEDLLDNYVERREDVRLAMEEVFRAEETVRLEKAASRPSIELAGGYGRRAGSGFEGDEEVWSAGLKLTQNIFDGGVTKHKTQAAFIKSKAIRERLRQTRLNARKEILDAHSLIEEQRTRLATARSAEASAQEAYRLERIRYENGLSSVTDTLISHADWLTQRSEVISALADINKAVVAFELATGGIKVQKGEES